MFLGRVCLRIRQLGERASNFWGASSYSLRGLLLFAVLVAAFFGPLSHVQAASVASDSGQVAAAPSPSQSAQLVDPGDRQQIADMSDFSILCDEEDDFEKDFILDEVSILDPNSYRWLFDGDTHLCRVHSEVVYRPPSFILIA